MRTQKIPLELYAVYYGRWITIGYLYLQNKDFVVLINNVSSAAHLGKLEPFRDKYCEPEATLQIIPKNKINKIAVYKKQS